MPDVQQRYHATEMPKYLSSDQDPLFRFQRWLANLRILEVDKIKSIPCTPRSHAFVERLIGTIRREYLDQTLFWNQGDLERKLDCYKSYYNRYRCHTGLAGITPAQRSGAPAHPIANLRSYRWREHCDGSSERIHLITIISGARIPIQTEFLVGTGASDSRRDYEVARASGIAGQGPRLLDFSNLQDCR